MRVIEEGNTVFVVADSGKRHALFNAVSAESAAKALKAIQATAGPKWLAAAWDACESAEHWRQCAAGYATQAGAFGGAA